MYFNITTHIFYIFLFDSFGEDEISPFGPKCSNWIGFGLQIIDALDTMYIMGFKDELKKSRDWVSNHLFKKIPSKSISFFETTIRCLGGLMSIYDLTKDQMYVDKAEILGIELNKAFESPTGLPYSYINLKTGKKSVASWAAGGILLAEVGSVQLEFTSLAGFNILKYILHNISYGFCMQY